MAMLDVNNELTPEQRKKKQLEEKMIAEQGQLDGIKDPREVDPRNKPGYWEPTSPSPPKPFTSEEAGNIIKKRTEADMLKEMDEMWKTENSPTNTNTSTSGSTNNNVVKDTTTKTDNNAPTEDNTAPSNDGVNTGAEPTVSPSVYSNIVESILNKSEGKNASDIYDQFMAIMGEEINAPDVMSDAEAQARARNKFNTAFESQMKGAMRDIDKNALKTGFYGQLPTEQLKANAMAQMEGQKEAAINSHASDLVTDSQDASNAAYNRGMNERNSRANMLASAVNSYVNLDNNDLNRLTSAADIINSERDQNRADEELQLDKDTLDFNKDKFEFDKTIVEADVTGYYKGIPTLAREKINKELAVQWARVENDKEALEKSGARNKEEFAANLYAEAYDKAIDYFKEAMGDTFKISQITDDEELKAKFDDVIYNYIQNYNEYATDESLHAGDYLEK